MSGGVKPSYGAKATVDCHVLGLFSKSFSGDRKMAESHSDHLINLKAAELGSMLLL
jgi:hypothetical protein